MGYHSDDAEALAGDICAAHIYPMLADLVVTATRYCAWDSAQLTDEQIEQITRASLHACDGVCDRIAQTIDTRRAYDVLKQVSDDSP